MARPRDYDRHKDNARRKQAEQSLAGRDIGDPPPVANEPRRNSCERNFRLFCETYFAPSFSLAWSQDHLKVIAKIETAVLTGGLFAVAMPRGSGKALATDTPLPTPAGWTTMGEVRIGDTLYDERGEICRVRFATPVMTDRPCYRVTFDDGEAVVCDADHLWTVTDRFSRKNPLTLRTEDMAGRLILNEKRGWTEYRYAIPVCQPIQGESQKWDVSPYMLGVWLGDGTTNAGHVTVGDLDLIEMRQLIERHENFNLKGRRKPDAAAATYSVGMGRRLESRERVALECRVAEMTRNGCPYAEIVSATGASKRTVSNIRSRGKGVNATIASVCLQIRLRWLGVLGNKHIPPAYLRASVKDRIDLLRGLMDTDGSIAKNGSTAEYVTKLPGLRDDVMDLLAGLGFKRRYRTKIVKGRPYYRITFTPSDGRLVFDLPRKAARQQLRKIRISATRRIVGIEPVPTVPVRCIQVDSPSRLYLCGRGMVPTHNTTLAEAACIWAVVYGHQEFVALIGSDEGRSQDMLDSIKTELEVNDLLLEDFPKIIFPIRCLEGIPNRCNGQLCNGARTCITWTAREVVLPTIPGSKTSGAIIVTTGITGGIRGMKFKRQDGKAVRPSLVIVDDVQTDESARSLSQCATRESILSGAILGLAGPGKKISGIMPLTVIRPGDMADSILDRDKHPEWNGERTKMVYAFPLNTKLWEHYKQVRDDGFRLGDGGLKGTEFYRANREAMDEGAVVAWAERHNPDELSALQHAMNLKYRDEAAFFAEYQNEPLLPDASGEGELTPDDVCAKINRIARTELSPGPGRLTMFIDVHDSLLYWVVAAWEDDFTGYAVDYGTYPDQKIPYFAMRDARYTMSIATKISSLEGYLYKSLDTLTVDLLGRAWHRDDGAELKIDRCLIDANWGASTDVVYQFCRQSVHSAVITPSHGKYVGASSQPFSEHKRQLGERIGLNWRIPSVKGKRAVRHVVFDTNFWKTFVHARLAVPMGERGCLSLFGDRPEAHRLFAEHLTAEYRVKTEGRNRKLEEWKPRPDRIDNHWFDCLVGCAVGASIQGVELPQSGASTRPEAKQKVSFAELQRRKAARG